MILEEAMEKSSEGGMMTKRAALPDLPGQKRDDTVRIGNHGGAPAGRDVRYRAQCVRNVRTGCQGSWNWNG